MFFRIPFYLFLALGFIGCQVEHIPDPQGSIPENHEYREEDLFPKNREEVDYPLSGINRYGQNYRHLKSLIHRGSEDSLLDAAHQLRELLFGETSHDKQVYADRAYGGYLELLVFFGQKAKQSLIPSVMSEWRRLKKAFNNEIMEPCLSQDFGDCDRVRNAFIQTNRVGQIVLEMAQSNQDMDKKLKQLGLAFDFQGRRQAGPLTDYYLDTVLDLLTEKGSVYQKTPRKQWLRHLQNIEIIAGQTNWAHVTKKNIARYEAIKPWLRGLEKESRLHRFRSILIPYLSSYIQKAPSIKKELQVFIDKRVDKLRKEGKDLSEYPAYDKISFESFKTENMGAVFLVLELYFSGIDITIANQYISHVSSQERNKIMNSSYRIVKTLVRWDIAQLGIYSTEQLAQRFSTQKVKTGVFFQDTLDWSRSLTPLWSDFHSLRAPAMKTFLEGNIKYSSQYSVNEVLEFFQAINRNILKTVIYPNMIAFTYEMAQTEFSLVLRILWFTFTIKTPLILEYMVNGQYEYPWFNFINLQETSGYDRSERNTSLYRSEIYDAIYYFFTTRTFQKYGIQADSFLTKIGETLFKRRRGRYLQTLELQKQIYLAEDSVSNRFLKWCKGLSGKPEVETLSLEKLSDMLAPAPSILNESKGWSAFGHSLDNRYLSMYYRDHYKIDDLDQDNVNTTLDRYRLIFNPIYNTLLRYMKIVRDLQTDYPDLGIGSLDSFDNKIKEINFLRMSYFGMQKQLGERYSQCVKVAEDENRRRMRAVTYALRDYLVQIVYPVMKAIKKGEIDLNQGNSIIEEVHSFKKGMLDKILLNPSGDPMYRMSGFTFFLRVRQFLIEGVSYSKIIPSETIDLELEPVVGSHLKIPIPDRFLENRNRFPVSWYRAKRLYQLLDSPHEFATSITADLFSFDREITIRSLSQWTYWWKGLSDHIFSPMMQEQLEHEVIMVQIPAQDYITVFEPSCLVHRYEELDKRCIKKHEPDFSPVVKVVEKILDTYILSPEDRDYFNLIESEGWINSGAMNTILNLEKTALGQSYGMGTSQIDFKGMAGVFDLTANMLKADYLGYLFETEYEISQGAENEMHSYISCESLREGCFFRNEKVWGVELFYARSLKSKFIFNFDLNILQDEFNHISPLVKGKFQRLIDLNNKSPDFLKEMQDRYPQFSGDVLVSLSRPRDILKPLSYSHQNPETDFDEFFKEKTQGFYLKEHNWEEFIFH